MNTPRKKCPSCSAGMSFGSYRTDHNIKLTGWLCLPCGTITERFGKLDVVFDCPDRRNLPRTVAA